MGTRLDGRYRRGIVLVLVFLLPAASTWADTLTNQMNAVTARVLCLPVAGEPGSGSGFVVGGGAHVVTNWHVVSCAAEGGQVGILLDASRGDAIGRDPALARLVLPAHCTAISQRHARVTYQAGQAGFGLEDCWSTNGVFLMTAEGGGKRLRPGQTYPLAPGARFYLGTPEIAFQVDLDTIP